MSRRRLILTAAACLSLGFLINFAIAAILGARPNPNAFNMGFGFVEGSFAPSVNWAGDRGRDRIGIAHTSGLETATIPKLESRFRSVFGQPNGSLTVAQQNEWVSRLFPRWCSWAYQVTAQEGSRRTYANGFPLRSFAGYDRGAQISFSIPEPAGGYRETGFLWRDNNSPVRAVVYIPLPLGTAVNSALFASPLLVLAFFPSLRRSLRVRRGHCPRCNYDLRADLSSGCPECGWNRATPAET